MKSLHKNTYHSIGVGMNLEVGVLQEPLGGSGGMLPRKNLKIRWSETLSGAI